MPLTDRNMLVDVTPFGQQVGASLPPHRHSRPSSNPLRLLLHMGRGSMSVCLLSCLKATDLRADLPPTAPGLSSAPKKGDSECCERLEESGEPGCSAAGRTEGEAAKGVVG